MKVAILALTCGRVSETAKTWPHNLDCLEDYTLYHWDNTEDPNQREAILKISSFYEIEHQYLSPYNQGISRPINVMMKRAFKDGADIVVTMANDILEPSGWINRRVEAFQEIQRAGIVSIPIAGQACIRYPRKEVNGIYFEEGDIIGNFAISRAVFEAIGGFPEYYGLYGPIDLDYCAHARKAGFRTIYLSDYEARHIGTNNPADYQKAKDESLAKSWALYRERMKALQ